MSNLSSSLLVKPQNSANDSPLNSLDEKLVNYESELKASTKTLNMADNITSLIPLEDGSLIFATMKGHVFRVDSDISNEAEKLYTEAEGGRLLMTKDERVLIYSGIAPIIIAFRDGVRYELQGHEKPVSNLLFSPDETYLISASADSNVIVWNLNQNFKISTKCIGHTGLVKSAKGVRVLGC